jgi:excisionase family DNA binding protein
MYSPRTAARELNVSRGTLYKWLREKRLTHVRMGKSMKARLFVPQNAIDKFLAESRVEAD